MQIIVGTTVQTVSAQGRGRPFIQNLGPGTVYFDSEPTVSATSGAKLAPDSAYEFIGAASEETGISLIADAAGTDVRIVWMGV